MTTSENWQGKRVLITGATGFIGRHLVSRFSDTGAQIFAATSPSHGPGPRPAEGKPTVQRLAFDIRDAVAVQTSLDEAAPDVVFHLAAVGVTDPNVDPMLALMVNGSGVINLLEGLRGRGVERAVLVGTCYEYGASTTDGGLDPQDAYSASKVAAWAFGHMYWRAYGLPVTTVRPFQVYGPGQSERTLIPSAVRTALAGEDFPMTPGKQVRDFVFVDDVVEGMMAAALSETAEGKSLDLGTGRGITVLHVVERIWRLTKARGRIRAGALSYRTGAAMNLVADADQTCRETGWRARTSLEEGLRATIHQLMSGER